MISVILVDDQTLVRQGIRSLLDLTDHIKVVGEAADGSKVLPLLSSLQVDVVLLDLQMPNMNGLEVLRALQAENIQIPCIILTTFDDDKRQRQCIDLNAKGFMLKDVSFEQLISNIEKVAAGESLLDPLPAITPSAALDPLTPRERDILRYMADGYSNREIAVTIHLSEGTTKNYVSNILSKLGVRDRTQAVLKALALGWV